MGVCVGAACGCPDWIISLSVVGGFVVYVLIGALIYVIVKSFKEDLELEWIIAFILLWPIIIVGGIATCVLYYIARLLAMPIIGADKFDLKDLENKVETKIDRKEDKIMDYLKYEYKPLKEKEATKVKAKSSKKVKKKEKK